MCDVNQSGYLSFLYDKTVHTLAFFEVQFVNSASVSGTIKNAYICIDKKKYYFEQVGSTYTTPATMSFAKPIDINAYRLQLPLVVAPHSVVKGFFLVPEFPVITDDFIRASIVFDLVRWKRHFNAQKFQVIVNRLNIDPQVQ